MLIFVLNNSIQLYYLIFQLITFLFAGQILMEKLFFLFNQISGHSATLTFLLL